jgi:hypothetical protein
VWAARLGGRNILEPPAGDFPAARPDDETSWAKALSELDRSFSELIGKIENVRDSDMPHEFMNKGYTLGFFLEGIVRHAVYHSGQIVILKKA